MATHWYYYVIVAAVVVAYAGWRLLRYQARRSAIRKFAADRGLTYTEREPALLDRCHGRPFDGYGRRRRTWHAVSGRWNTLDVLAFEYSEVLGNEGRSRRFWQQFTGVRLPFRTNEHFALRRNNLSHLARRVGLVPSENPDDTFDQEWYTGGTFTPEMREWVQRHRRPFRVAGGVLETWQTGRFEPDRMEAAVRDLAELLPLVGAVAGR